MNYIVADLISRLRTGSNNHLKTIKVLNTKISVKIIDLIYQNGFINGYKIEFNFILVYLKYYNNQPVLGNLKIINTPGRKIYWSLNKLSLKHNIKAFNGIYIISTSKGILTHNSCLLNKSTSGKILLKIYV